MIETSGDLDGAIALQDLGPLAAKTAVVLGLSSMRYVRAGFASLQRLEP